MVRHSKIAATILAITAFVSALFLTLGAVGLFSVPGNWAAICSSTILLTISAIGAMILFCASKSVSHDTSRTDIQDTKGKCVALGNIEVTPQFKKDVKSAIDVFHDNGGDRRACDTLYARAITSHDDITLQYVITEMKKGNVPLCQENERSIFLRLAADPYPELLLECLYKNHVEVPKWERESILFSAVSHKNANAIPILIKKFKIDPNFQDNFGRTALHYAVMLKDLKCVRILIESGADIHIIDNDQYSPIDTVLEKANDIKDFTIAQYFIDTFPHEKRVEILREAISTAGSK